jgi:aromatic-L-amino-acid/L-tryptophan decarboxylase
VTQRASRAFDWSAEEWEKAGRRALDLAIKVSTRWGGRAPAPAASPEDVRRRFREPLPLAGVPFEEVMERLEAAAELSTYIGHPRWLAYITSSPAPVGVLADLVTSAVNPNLGLWRGGPAGTAIELQSIDWLKELLGYPPQAEGVYSSGGQFANVLALAVMRDRMAGWDVRTAGTHEGPRLRLYVSEELHYCHQQAAEMLGLGREAVRLIPTDERYRMRLDAVREAITTDRVAGHKPIGVIATAGTVGTGAVDPIPELRKLTRAEGLWLHVDGAYGAFAVIAPSAPPELRAIAEADSIACDPHKWLYAPIDAGITLVREPGLLERSFAFHAAYLHHDRDADARVDLAELGPENSRRARALKVWACLLAYGVDGYRQMIEQNIRIAAHLERIVGETDDLVLAAPRGLSIVCWRVEPPGIHGDALEALQHRVIEELQRSGIAMVSNALLKGGGAAIRACVVNFRTSEEDIEAVAAATGEIGRKLVSTT